MSWACVSPEQDVVVLGHSLDFPGAGDVPQGVYRVLVRLSDISSYHSTTSCTHKDRWTEVSDYVRPRVVAQTLLERFGESRASIWNINLERCQKNKTTEPDRIGRTGERWVFMLTLDFCPAFCILSASAMAAITFAHASKDFSCVFDFLWIPRDETCDRSCALPVPPSLPPPPSTPVLATAWSACEVHTVNLVYRKLAAA
eukprot:767700-Hanusia_phi.AAC.8